MLETLWAYTKILITIFTIILINFKKKDFLIHLILSFLQERVLEPRNVSWVFDFFFFYRGPLKRQLTNAKDTRSRARCLYAIVCFYFFKKRIVFEFDDNIFLVGTAWRQTFVMVIRNVSGDIKISPGNSLGDSFTFCRHESIVRWEPSFRVKF